METISALQAVCAEPNGCLRNRLLGRRSKKHQSSASLAFVRNSPVTGEFRHDYPAVVDFSQKMEVTVMAPNHGGDNIESILGPIGHIGSKKWVKTVKNYHAQKFEFSITPGSSVFPKKWKLRLWRQITVGTP